MIFVWLTFLQINRMVRLLGDGGPYDMIHTENFMLIDKKRQIRGFYDGTNFEEIERLLKDIKILKASYKN